MKNTKTHADKIREAVTDLVEAGPNEIMQWIAKHYPEDKINPQSYRADIIGCSKNHSSQHHYPGMPKFLLFDSNTKKYRLDPLETPKIQLPSAVSNERVEAFLNRNFPEQRDMGPKEPDDSSYIDGVGISKLSVTGQIEIPLKIRIKMGLNPGDTVAFIEGEKGVEIRKARLRLDFS